jgi:hypothetical protein
MINVYQPQRHLRSAGTLSLVVPRARTRYGERQFNVSAATIWNKLPDSTDGTQSKHLQKTAEDPSFYPYQEDVVDMIPTSVKRL